MAEVAQIHPHGQKCCQWQGPKLEGWLRVAFTVHQILYYSSKMYVLFFSRPTCSRSYHCTHYHFVVVFFWEVVLFVGVVFFLAVLLLLVIQLLIIIVFLLCFSLSSSLTHPLSSSNPVVLCLIALFCLPLTSFSLSPSPCRPPPSRPPPYCPSPCRFPLSIYFQWLSSSPNCPTPVLKGLTPLAYFSNFLR